MADIGRGAFAELLIGPWVEGVAQSCASLLYSLCTFARAMASLVV